MKRDLTSKTIRAGIYVGSQPIYMVLYHRNGCKFNTVIRVTKGVNIFKVTENCEGFQAYSTKSEALKETGYKNIDYSNPEDIEEYYKSVKPIIYKDNQRQVTLQILVR